MSHHITIEEQVLQAFDKFHNQSENNTTESAALDLLSDLPSPSTIKDKDKFSLLHYACYNGWYRVTKKLIKKLCDPNAENINGSTPLHLACKSGNLELVKYLVLQQNCDPNKANIVGLVPLHNAALEGHAHVAKYLIEEKQCTSTPRDSNGITPLHLACQSGNLRMVKYFVQEQNCDAVCVTNDRYTQPLHLACQNGHLEVAKYLIEEQHSDPGSVDVKGFQPVHLACKSGNLSLVHYLVQKQNCKPDCINISYEYIWWTPLHLACENGHLMIAKYLIKEMKCDPMYKNSEGLTPLHLACRNGHLNVVKYLIEEQKCDPNCKKKNGCTPLHSACQNGHLEVSKYLIEEQRVHPSCKSNYYWTPLHMACDGGHLLTVKYLTDIRHCDPASKTYHGNTPLSLAYKSHHFSVIIHLIQECKCSALESGIALTDYVVKNHPEIALFLVASSKLVHQPINFTVEKNMFYPVFKIFIFGNELGGKTTLIRAIESHIQNSPYYNWITEQLPLKREDPKLSQSAGIVPVHIKKYSSENHFILYDFAGRSSYHASHAAFLENITLAQGSLILIVIDLRKSLQQCVDELQYWKSFIDNQFNRQASQMQRPEIAIVGSHADVLTSNGENPDHRTKQIIRHVCGSEGVRYDNVVADCRMKMSDGIKNICQKIFSLCDMYMKKIDISIQIHFLKYLLQKYSMNEKTACTFADLKDLVCSEENSSLKNGGLIPTEDDQLLHHLTNLSDNGQLLFLKNLDDINASWIVFNVDFILSSMNSFLFSHEITLHISNKNGVVSLSEITKMFPNNDPKLLTRLMIQFEICCEINLPEARLINSNVNDLDEYFFFPHLANTDPPLEIIVKLSQYRCGWHCRQTKDHKCSTPRFMQTIIIKLMTRFIISKCEQPTLICTVWKTGMQWQDSSGIQAFVKFVEQDFTVVVEVGSESERETECHIYRSKIIETILRVKDKVLGAIEIQENFFEHSQPRDEIQYESMDRKG